MSRNGRDPLVSKLSRSDPAAARALLVDALEMTRGNIARACAALFCSRPQLYVLLNRLNAWPEVDRIREQLVRDIEGHGER